MKKHILHTYAFNLQYARTLTDTIDEEKMTYQPVPGMNHPAWILGHLAVTSGFAASLLGLEENLPEEWQQIYGQGSKLADDT